MEEKTGQEILKQLKILNFFVIFGVINILLTLLFGESVIGLVFFEVIVILGFYLIQELSKDMSERS
jgi:hypothetical protein